MNLPAVDFHISRKLITSSPLEDVFITCWSAFGSSNTKRRHQAMAEIWAVLSRQNTSREPCLSGPFVFPYGFGGVGAEKSSKPEAKLLDI